MKYSLLLCLLFLTYIRCETPNPWSLRGKFNVSPLFYIDLFHVKTGHRIFSDTIRSRSFDLKIKDLEKGIYQVILSWDRDIVRPQEMERFVRQPELGTPKYYMAATFWLDAKESNNYKLLLDSVYQQAELQEILLAKNGGELVKMAVVSDGKNNKIYNDYLRLVDCYKLKNRQQKDSLQQLVLHYNDLKLFGDSERLSVLLAKDWLANVKTALLREEMKFMKNNINSEVIAHIYHILVNTREDFEQYHEVYNLFPLSVKQDLAVWH